MQPVQIVTHDEALCSDCQEVMQPEMIHNVDRESPWLNHTLAKLGVPPYDVVKVEGADDERHFVLAADSDSVHGHGNSPDAD